MAPMRIFKNIFPGRILAAALILTVWCGPGEARELEGYSKILWDHLEAICALGPRPPGSAAHQKLQDYIKAVGRQYADSFREQKFSFTGATRPKIPLTNIELVFNGTTRQAPLVLGAHYDTRPFADKEEDPYSSEFPIPGANDGGSGTAVLLALAQYLHANPPQRPVRLVFFDGEDYGFEFTNEYFLGSKYYARQLLKQDKAEWPEAVVIIDMVGDKDLEIFKEKNSLKNAPRLLNVFFETARRLKVPQFNQEVGRAVLDDHISFLKIGIPAAVLIDIHYPYWHTLADTLDKCSPESLFAVFLVVVEGMRDI
ncbi:MAG: M28 family peptidase [Nitrospinaceae bacterium]|nr:M28 family peptidase [Nitrospinaceae bacterium]NIT82460.1 M28 family peptidase [Nitrospinaceae bacterium]NIU96831.1 M28 family peptidase [Nitrospinaceae bacterium]NIW59420.1 M28 family peptidase [Nitrospinaceae bacterium]